MVGCPRLRGCRWRQGWRRRSLGGIGDAGVLLSRFGGRIAGWCGFGRLQTLVDLRGRLQNQERTNIVGGFAVVLGNLQEGAGFQLGLQLILGDTEEGGRFREIDTAQHAAALSMRVAWSAAVLTAV